MSWQGEVFKGKIGFTMKDSTPRWNLPPRPPAGTPNVLIIVMDDVAYGHFGRTDIDLPWEHTGLAEDLREAAGLD